MDDKRRLLEAENKRLKQSHLPVRSAATSPRKEVSHQPQFHTCTYFYVNQDSQLDPSVLALQQQLSQLDAAHTAVKQGMH